MITKQMIELISAGLSLAEAAARGVASAIAARDALKAMVAEGRDPTDEEWAAINAAIDADIRAIEQS